MKKAVLSIHGIVGSASDEVNGLNDNLDLLDKKSE